MNLESNKKIIKEEARICFDRDDEQKEKTRYFLDTKLTQGHKFNEREQRFLCEIWERKWFSKETMELYAR